jgi:hypothetical protein
MKTFSQTQPKQDLEPDRLPLVDGITFTITRIVLSDKTQYGMIAKIDGVHSINKQSCKYYTTSQVITSQCAEILKSDRTLPDGNLRDPVGVQVKKVKAKNGTGNYLTFADPA